MFTVIRRFFTETTNKAAAIVGNHAFNDFDGLIDSLITGDGRNAARASRSLFEHLINYCEVASSEVAAERYIAHRAVTAESLSKLNRGLTRLKGKEYRKERQRLSKLGRESENDLRSAIAKFGKSFRRDWASRNLRDRAVAHGYGDDYEVYRLLSQVTHGSGGGVLGSYIRISGSAIHRTGGPSLELAIISYLEGITFFRNFAREIETRQSIPTSGLVKALNDAIDYWPDYRKMLQALDKETWPSEPPPSPAPVMALYPGGGIRWFLWEPALMLLKLAQRPAEADWIEEQFKKKIASGELTFPDLGGRPITSAVHDLHVSPLAEAEWFPADAIFIPQQPPSKVAWFNPK
ncbi:DUF5677 domain-containing protein [Streptomyces anulatus]|uniref:DUF5677 domain-containing protein n=1 Tax=Streptomyces anulatus TaxID=1892 RepID=UPI002F91363D